MAADDKLTAFIRTMRRIALLLVDATEHYLEVNPTTAQIRRVYKDRLTS